MNNQRRILTAAILAASTMALATESTPTPGSLACEVDWNNRSNFQSIPTVGHVRAIERAAERNNLSAQLRLGLLREATDGKWTAPADRSYNRKWLEKAKAQGSKTAEWELSRLAYRPMAVPAITHEAYLNSAIEAAEKDGNPWAATELMNLTNGRWGATRQPTSCSKDWTIDGKCAPETQLPISTASKWAKIAAEGGNATAQEWICRAASVGNLDRGQAKDDALAFKWCQIAVNNACASESVEILQVLYRNGRGTKLNIDETERIDKQKKQPWRVGSQYFFTP